MKTFKKFIQEQPTMSGGNPQAFSQAADDSGPVAGIDKKLFPSDIDLLDQGFQAAGESGQSRYNTYSNVYPVMKVTLSNNQGDGPSIDSMVAASKKFVNIEAQKTADRLKKTYQQFMGFR